MILLTDTFLANSSEPWKLPDVASLPKIDPDFATDPTGFMPYARRRPRASLGGARHAGLRHRIGGLEKEDGTGNISYAPANHEHMTHLRAERIARVSVPDIEVDDPDGASLLVLGWGSSYGAIRGAARRLRSEKGLRLATAHISHLNPLPGNTGEVLRSFERVLVPEMNMGQLVKLLRAEFLVDCESFTKVDGLPIFTRDMMEVIEAVLEGKADFSSDPRRRAGAQARGDYAVLASVQSFMPELGIAGPDRVRDRHRLRRPVRLLHGHLRHARHPRTRASPGHRRRHLSGGPLRLGGEWRRRRSRSATTT